MQIYFLGSSAQQQDSIEQDYLPYVEAMTTFQWLSNLHRLHTLAAFYGSLHTLTGLP